MTTFRPMKANDLFKFNHINLDPLTGRIISLNIFIYLYFYRNI